MCYHHEEEWRRQNGGDENRYRGTPQTPAADLITRSAALVERLRSRLVETEARLERARAREAQLSRELDEMKRFVSVMEIMEAYLNRRFVQQRETLVSLLLSFPTPR